MATPTVSSYVKISIAGGVHTSTMGVNDNGATFSDAKTGARTQVHGVNDGTSNNDAVNVRQFYCALASLNSSVSSVMNSSDSSAACLTVAMSY